MTTTYSQEHTRRGIKAAVAAKAILARMKAIGVEMTAAQAYEALAAAEGYRNWATMKAKLQESGTIDMTAAERFRSWASSQPDDRAGRSLKRAAVGEAASVAELCGELGLVPLHLFDARRIMDGFHSRDADKFERRFGEAEILDIPKTVAMLQAYVRSADAGTAYEDFVQGYMEEVFEGLLPGEVEWLDALVAERPAL